MYNYQPKDVIIEGKWLVLSKIGQGSFGEVFKVQDIHTNRFYAIKRESSETHYPQLYHESTIYNILKNGPCIPKYHWYGQYDGYECIVLELLGSSLKKFQQIVKDIPLDIVIELGCQLISCLEYIHSKGLVYRDIKPENFLFSKSCVLETHATNSRSAMISSWEKKEIALYAVDFGLTTWWQNPKTKKPFPDSKKPIKFKTGTARYASLNVHHGHTHTRRDDMESLGYVLLDLLLGGNLPWSGVTARTSKAGWDRLMSIKEDISLEDLCHGLPHGIMNFIDYTRRLQFSEQPDYIHLQELLRACTQPGPFSKSVTTSYSSHSTFSRNKLDNASFQNILMINDLFQDLPSSQQQQQQQQQEEPKYYFQPIIKNHHSSSSSNYYKKKQHVRRHNNNNNNKYYF